MRAILILAVVLAASTPARADAGFPLTKISKVKTKGGHKAKAITKQLKAVADFFGLCWANDITIGRKHTIGFQINADGTASMINPDSDADRCFENALARLTFPEQNGLSLVTFVATFVPTKSRKRPEGLDAPVPVRTKPEPTGTPSVVIGGGNPDYKGPSTVTFALANPSTKRSALKDQLSAFYTDARQCNEYHGSPTNTGTITIQLVIEASGATKATLTKTTGVPQALADCLNVGKRYWAVSKLDDASAPPVEATLTLTFTP